MSEEEIPPAPEEEEAQEDDSAAKGLWRPALLILVLVALLVLGRVFELDRYVDKMEGWIDALGPWGPLAFVGLYMITTVAMVPATLLSLLGGAIFGPWLGTVLVSAGTTLGAAASFLIARYFAREATADWIAEKKRIRKLDRLVTRYGAVIVAISRLVPFFPFILLNYAFGLTGVRFRTYLFWSWLCMLPANFLFTAGGGIYKKLFAGDPLSWLEVIALTVDAVLIVLLTSWARSVLRHRRARDASETAPAGEPPPSAEDEVAPPETA